MSEKNKYEYIQHPFYEQLISLINNDKNNAVRFSALVERFYKNYLEHGKSNIEECINDYTEEAKANFYELPLDKQIYSNRINSIPSQFEDQTQNLKDRIFNAFIAGYANLQLEAIELIPFFDNWFNDNINLFNRYRLNNTPEWLSEKPEFTKDCILLTASLLNNEWEYQAWEIKKLDGEDDQGNAAWYWGWCCLDGEEYGDINDLEADRYKIIVML